MKGVALLGLICVCAWITHIVYCFSDDRWGFLIAGAVFFPIAICHGIFLWFAWLFQFIWYLGASLVSFF